jgi:endoglucanase
MKPICSTFQTSFCLLILVGITGLDIFQTFAVETVWATSAISALHTDGRIVMDSSGRAVLLKGLNIETHNWAYEDAFYNDESKTWSIESEVTLISTMQQMNTWLLTSTDMQYMKEWGANVIRLQVSHYFFESINSPGEYYEWAFSKLNEWINLAAENGLYVIIDLHTPYGGRQYNCANNTCIEGKTLWLNPSERQHVVNLWREIARRTQGKPSVLYELMNEPYPQRAGVPNDEWWYFAQELVNAIRVEGAQQLIIAANPLPNEPFFKLSDSVNAIAYDFHFYLPYQFTHQQAYWMNPPYPPASYPYPDGWEWLENTFDHDEADFTGSTDWTLSWHETFSTANELSNKQPTHVRPTLSSYDNIGPLSFDNVWLFIDNVIKPQPNHEFENGSGEFPNQWTQWGQEGTGAAYWEQDAINGNRFVTIPATGLQKSRAVMPEWGAFVELPIGYHEIKVVADVRGVNRNQQGNHANVFGMDWVKRTIYDRNRMESDIAKYQQFGQTNNVPVMCLEFGVIMAATEAQGHLAWLRDFSSLIKSRGIHGAYHVYRGFDDNITHKSFGIYQCWGKPAFECPEDRKFEFVVPTLTTWFARPQSIPPLMLLLD